MSPEVKRGQLRDQESRFVRARNVLTGHSRKLRADSEEQTSTLCTDTEYAGPAAARRWGRSRLTERVAPRYGFGPKEADSPPGLCESVIQLRHWLIPSTWMAERHQPTGTAIATGGTRPALPCPGLRLQLQPLPLPRCPGGYKALACPTKVAGTSAGIIQRTMTYSFPLFFCTMLR